MATKVYPTISTPKFGDLVFKNYKGGTKGPVQIFQHKSSGQATGLQLTLSGKPYVFVPQNIVEKGWVQDGKQYYLGNLLDEYNSKMLLEQSEVINLSGIGNYDQIAKDRNISTTGFLLPFRDASRTGLVTDNVRKYDPTKTDYHGAITGLSFIDNKPVYLTSPKGSFDGGTVVQAWIQPRGTIDYSGGSSETGEFWARNFKKGRSPLGSFGDFINDIVSSDLFKIGSLALGAYGLANLAAAPAAAGAGAAGAGAGAAGASLAPSSFQAALPGLGIETAATAAGATAVPGSFAAALPGLVAPVGILDLPSTGLLDTTTFPKEGIKATPATTGGASAPFATTPAYTELTTVVPAGGGAATVPGLSVPGLSSMGGGTGLTVPVTGGTVTEMGFVPTGATPSLGDPASFINNPDYLGSPVISEDYLALTGADMPGGISIKDALDAARLGSQLLSPQQQMIQQGGLLGGGGVNQPMGVDFSPLYGRTMVGLLPLAEQYRRSLL